MKGANDSQTWDNRLSSVMPTPSLAFASFWPSLLFTWFPLALTLPITTTAAESILIGSVAIAISASAGKSSNMPCRRLGSCFPVLPSLLCPTQSLPFLLVLNFSLYLLSGLRLPFSAMHNLLSLSICFSQICQSISLGDRIEEATRNQIRRNAGGWGLSCKQVKFITNYRRCKDKLQ